MFINCVFYHAKYAISMLPGLYKQLTTLRDLLSEYRESPDQGDALIGPIIVNLEQAGLQEDCPYVDEVTGESKVLTQEMAEEMDKEVGGLGVWGFRAI